MVGKRSCILHSISHKMRNIKLILKCWVGQNSICSCDPMTQSVLYTDFWPTLYFSHFLFNSVNAICDRVGSDGGVLRKTNYRRPVWLVLLSASRGKHWIMDLSGVYHKYITESLLMNSATRFVTNASLLAAEPVIKTSAPFPVLVSVQQLFGFPYKS